MNRKSKGGVSKKVIHGRTYFYFQWYENGKKRSRTISETEYNNIIEEKRGNPTSLNHFDNLFGIQYLSGEALLQSISFVSTWEKRDCFEVLDNFLTTPINGKVMILYGLRRTGKTSLLFQSILNHKDKINKTAYLLLDRTSTMGNVNLALNELVKNGYEYVYIDEVTLAEDFISSSQFLSDIYALRMKLVLSGTDSLGFKLASDNELYDRNYMIHTTYISFKEFSRLLKINDIDQYIEYGGTLVKEGIDYHGDNYPSFYNAKTTLAYIDTAISKNIQRSLERYKDGDNFNRIRALRSSGELTGIINKVVQDNAHRFVASTINRVFKSQDYGSLREILRKNEDETLRTVLDTLDEENIYKSLMDKLDINNVFVNQDTVDELYRYFLMLDIVEELLVINLDNNYVHKETIFTQPGLRYSIAKELIESLLYEGQIINLPNASIDIIFETLLNDVKGHILEEIVQLDEIKRNKKNVVYKLSFITGEIDMCVIGKDSRSCSIYEIKHSSEIDNRQIRHLKDEKKIDLINYRFGNIENRYVLYRGIDKEIDNVQYKNVADYLKR